MNSFTKEELEEIGYGLGWMIDAIGDAPLTSELRDKVQAMIDNYCEHKKNVTTLYTISGDYPFGGFCRDCGSFVDEIER